MNTFKLGKTGTIILVIVILFIILIAISEVNKNGNQNKEEGKLARLWKRWQEIQREIQSEMAALSVTREMEGLLEQKINRMFLIGKSIFILSFITITLGYRLNGLDIIASLLSSAATTAFIFCAVSFITINRFADANE